MSLIRELDKRLRVLDQLQKDVREATAKVRVVPTDRDALAVLALRLQWLYGCIEDFAARVSSQVNGEVPGGPGGHIALLRRMYVDVPGRREPLFRRTAFEDLEALLKFRHFVRTNYGAELDGAKLLSVAERAERALPLVLADLREFRDRRASQPPPPA